jgi:hypothetical protein
MSFKKCICGHAWASSEAFMSDPDIKLLGYQVDFEVLKEGFFLFNHLVSGCQTTLSIPAGFFLISITGLFSRNAWQEPRNVKDIASGVTIFSAAPRNVNAPLYGKCYALLRSGRKTSRLPEDIS